MPPDSSFHSHDNKSHKQSAPEHIEQEDIETRSRFPFMGQQVEIDPQLWSSRNILHLQRVVGNRQVGKLLGKAHQSNNVGVIQRTIPARDGSNPQLKQIYDELIWRSLLLRILGDVVGKPRQVRIAFGKDEETGGRNAAYVIDKHEILINDKLRHADPAEIKHFILVELNHMREIIHTPADNKGIQLPKQKQDKNDDLYRALEALRMEYHEWISSYLTHVQTKNVNEYTPQSKKKSEPNQEIKPGYAGAYETEEAGWYIFEYYLKSQVETHTTAYDQKAADKTWKGWGLLDQAEVTLGSDAFNIEDVLTPMDTSDLEGYEDSYIIDPTLYHELLRRENPFKGSTAQSILDEYAELLD